MSNWPLFFDIPGVDRLLCPDWAATKDVGSQNDPRSLCLAGPDGVGKSILALHSSAIYAATRLPSNRTAKVVYLSTDFSHSQAKEVWDSFLLGSPLKRRRALQSHYGWEFPLTDLSDCELKNTDIDTIANVLDDKVEGTVYFLDLQRHSVGDEWLFLSKLISLLAFSRRKGDPLPLVVIDAIEGLDLFGGERDSFGEPTTRRNRVARLFRNASQILSEPSGPGNGHPSADEKHCGGCHLLMTVEEPDSNQRLPEQFVADAVVRLRSAELDHYLSRSIEIEKARGLPHVRGQHPYSIRSGKGKSSLDKENVDDPMVDAASPERSWEITQRHTSEGPKQPLAHFVVAHSVNAVSRLASSKIHQSRSTVRFGLPLLDWALKSEDNAIGLAGPCFAVLSGEPGTHKSMLSKAFLADAFSDDNIDRDIEISLEEKPKKMGAAILLTTDHTSRDQLINGIREHFKPSDLRDLNALIDQRLLIRYLEPHYLSSAEFLFIIRQLIQVAKRVLSGSFHGSHEMKHKIHFVIDDFQSMLQQHPSLLEDHLILPMLRDIFYREGISVLFVSSRDSRRDSSDSFRLLVNNLDVVQIKTWKVHFLGVRRTAISVSAPGCHMNNMVFELRVNREKKGGQASTAKSLVRLEVSNEFDIYSGIEHDRPIRIPLHLELYTGLHAASEVGKINSNYLAAIESSFRKLFKGNEQRDVIDFNEARSYHDMAAVVELLDNSRLDHTLIVQLDEFWKCHESDCGLLELDETYLAKESLFGDPANDHPKIGSGKRPNRNMGFCEYQLSDSDGTVQAIPKTEDRRDRVPYLWDFGFLMARRDLFWKFRNETVFSTSIGSIWNHLCSESDRFPSSHGTEVSGYVRWTEFLKACRLIAPAGVLAFDLDLRSESLSCLVLENWLSSITGDSCPNSDAVKKHFTEDNSPSELSLLELLDKHLVSLWNVLDDLHRVLSHIEIDNNEIRKHDPDSSAVASRHWYSTACVAAQSEFAQTLVPLRLPGSCCMRGDWSLGVAYGSRSVQLACQSLDVLTSKQMNIMRLHDGLGLPTRNLVRPCCDQVAAEIATDDMKSVGMLRTALTRWDPVNQQRSNILFRELLSLAPSRSSSDEGLKSSGFYFIRRSRLVNYSRDRFYWRRWLGRILKDAHLYFPVSERATQFPDEDSWLNHEVPYRSHKERFKEVVGLLKTVLRSGRQELR